jgi:hypothetical protein
MNSKTGISTHSLYLKLSIKAKVCGAEQGKEKEMPNKQMVGILADRHHYQEMFR